MLLSVGLGLMNASDRPPHATRAFINLMGFWLLLTP